jgi:YtkA-like
MTPQHWYSGLWAIGLALCVVAPLTFGASTACNSTCSKPGGPTPGPADMHCGAMVQVTDPSVCKETALGGSGGSGTTSVTSSASSSTAGSTVSSSGSGSTASSTSVASSSASGGADNPDSEYGPTNYGLEADDDDCKYHVTWSATPICEKAGVTFTVKVVTKSDGKPVAKAGTLIEAVLGDTHPAPNSNAATTEPTPGTYEIGPILFDEPGKWTVRFHIHEDCSDVSEASQHGHAAFFVDVP